MMHQKAELWVYAITHLGTLIDIRGTKESAEKELERIREIDKSSGFKIEAWEVEE